MWINDSVRSSTQLNVTLRGNDRIRLPFLLLKISIRYAYLFQSQNETYKYLMYVIEIVKETLVQTNNKI